MRQRLIFLALCVLLLAGCSRKRYRTGATIQVDWDGAAPPSEVIGKEEGILLAMTMREADHRDRNWEANVGRSGQTNHIHFDITTSNPESCMKQCTHVLDAFMAATNDPRLLKTVITRPVMPTSPLRRDGKEDAPAGKATDKRMEATAKALPHA